MKKMLEMEVDVDVEVDWQKCFLCQKVSLYTYIFRLMYNALILKNISEVI